MRSSLSICAHRAGKGAQGQDRDTTTVTVTVTDVNEAPLFGAEEYALSIAEDAAVGAAVGTVAAVDPDADDTLSYSITAGNDGGEFSIDASGSLSVAKVLDYETTTSYTLTVEAADPDSLSDTATVTVSVTNVNEAPSFDTATMYTFTLAEDTQPSILKWEPSPRRTRTRKTL